ncbi:hypothetical protein NW762_010696 [Fusarium torreyae]|uniref:Uncharacterized protein n=1 Tax=Fusarium torreyae TaxID=1237075 RepID=A0A9W8RT20_9HYPO|nr:hypothetical protein NW762_010696 [Fusarium torreyae]
MVAGTIHLLSMHDEKESIREEGKTYYEAALKFLQELSCYWRHAGLMVNRLERFHKQCEDRHRELQHGTPNTEHSPSDVEALWQSVDYALLSAPTRPASPTPAGIGNEMDWFSSPSQLFDFADFSVFAEGVGTFGALQTLGSDALQEMDTENMLFDNVLRVPSKD